MVETWLSVFQTKATDWNIPVARVTSLTSAMDMARAILAVVKSGERTPASVVECNVAFKDLETETRFIKKHYLLLDPLTLTDFAKLLLPPPDATPSPIPPPTGQPVLSVTYPGGPHLLQVHFALLTGTEPPDRRGDYGYALYRGIMPQGGATMEQAAGPKHYLLEEPWDGGDLLHYRFTRRRKELVGFDAADSGMTAYFCSRYENQKGAVGNWGPLGSAVIP
jgi:hypothetical protein